jgi:protein-tyrosine phosphatase
VFDRFESLGGDPDLLRPVLGVEIEYLHASLGEMRKAYGTIEQYFSDGLRIGPEDQDSLRQALIL